MGSGLMETSDLWFSTKIRILTTWWIRNCPAPQGTSYPDSTFQQLLPTSGCKITAPIRCCSVGGSSEALSIFILVIQTYPLFLPVCGFVNAECPMYRGEFSVPSVYIHTHATFLYQMVFKTLGNLFTKSLCWPKKLIGERQKILAGL